MEKKCKAVVEIEVPSQVPTKMVGHEMLRPTSRIHGEQDQFTASSAMAEIYLKGNLKNDINQTVVDVHCDSSVSSSERKVAFDNQCYEHGD